MFSKCFIIGFGVSFGWFLARAIVKRIDYFSEAIEKVIAKKISNLCYKLEKVTSKLTGTPINEIHKLVGKENEGKVVIKGFRAE